MSFESEKVKQLKIYFLFIHADGEASPTEMKLLNEIVEKENLSESDLQAFQAFCGQMMLKPPSGNASTALAEIDRVLGQKHSAWVTLASSIDQSKTMQAKTIWSLINLGYADSEYSETEKRIVSHLIDRWEMDPILVAELNDTANTILALTLQKEWVKTTSKPYEKTNSMIQELDRNIASMFANVEISIAEAGIA